MGPPIGQGKTSGHGLAHHRAGTRDGRISQAIDAKAGLARRAPRRRGGWMRQ